MPLPEKYVDLVEVTGEQWADFLSNRHIVERVYAAEAGHTLLIDGRQSMRFMEHRYSASAQIVGLVDYAHNENPEDKRYYVHKNLMDPDIFISARL